MYTEITYNYIDGLFAHGGELQKIEEYAACHGVPIMRPTVVKFMETQVAMARPQEILELGTAIGYSGSVMLFSSDAHLTTIELMESNFNIASENFKKLGLNDRVTQILGDAGEEIERLDKKFDFIFLDSAKAQYIKMLGRLKELLSPGGVLVADNVLFRGYISGETETPKRHKTIKLRMNEFLKAITSDSDFVNSVLPFADGVSISVKRR